jgi:hypothetical protein
LHPAEKGVGSHEGSDRWMRYLIEDRYLMEVVIDDTHGSFSADCYGTAIVKSFLW